MKEKTVHVWRKSIQYFWSWEQLELKAKFCFEILQHSPTEMPVRGQSSSWHSLYILMKNLIFPRVLNRGWREECQIYSAWKVQFQLWCQTMSQSINNVHSAQSKYLSHVNGKYVQWSKRGCCHIQQLTFSDNIIYSECISYIQYCLVRKYGIFHSYFILFPFFLSLSFSLLPVLGYLLCSSFFLSFHSTVL